MAVVTLYPNAAGDKTNLTPQGAAANWDCVDEHPHNSDTTRVLLMYTGKYDKRDLYNIEDTSQTGYIMNVKLVVTSRMSSIYSNAMTALIKTHGTEYLGGTINPTTQSYAEYNYSWSNNPYTGVAWTFAEINALQIGISDNRGTNGVNLTTQVRAEITYTPNWQNTKTWNGVNTDNIYSYDAVLSENIGKRNGVTV